MSAAALNSTVTSAAALIFILFSYTQRRVFQNVWNGRHGPRTGIPVLIKRSAAAFMRVWAERRGLHAINFLSWLVLNPNSTKLISKHPRIINMKNLNKTNQSFHAINPFIKIYH